MIDNAANKLFPDVNPPEITPDTNDKKPTPVVAPPDGAAPPIAVKSPVTGAPATGPIAPGQPPVLAPVAPPPGETPPPLKNEQPPATDKSSPCTEGSLDLTVNDWNGHPISNLPLKVFVKNIEVFSGKTDGKGKIPTIENLKLDSNFEIRVKKNKPTSTGKTDDSEDYKFAAIGKIHSEESYACLQSPKTKFEFSTENHLGAPGQADKRKEKTIQNHNQIPTDKPEISGNPDKKPEVKPDRTDKGLPKASVIDGLQDWYGRNATNAGAPAVSASDLDHVKKLIEFGEKQAAWTYDSHTLSATYIKQMMDKRFVIPAAKLKDGYRNSVHMCTKYVKIALWYAGYGPESEEIGSNISPAREMGPALIAAGFKDITTNIPDARWAAPGDVIVYRKKGSATDSGHIDIRTYDGYLSDFLDTYLPIRQFEVIGIYRKYYDPLPEKRMRAFLMVIASREAKTIFLGDGYQEAYRTLPAKPGHPKDKFNSFDSHPFSEIKANSSPSGAYGIVVQTWKNYLPFLDLPENSKKFTPTVQDRIAIAIMEQTKNALALVRLGKVEEAAMVLSHNQWVSLPGARKIEDFSMSDMRQSFDKFLKEMM